MADERLQYQLTLNTVATGTGAKQTADDISRVRREASEASVSLNSSGGLKGAAESAGEGIQTFSTQAGKATLAGGQMGGKITQVGYQVQDFAVQVASGTSAVRAFSQQAPQLLSAFGPWGVIAGTAVAVAAPLIASLFQVGEAASEAGASVEEMAEAIAESNRKLIENLTERIDNQLEDQTKLRVKMDEVTAAEAKASAATLSNDEKIRLSKVAIAEAMGLQTDKYKEIELAENAAAAKRKLEAEQAVAAEKTQLEKAKLERADAQAAVAAERQKMAELEEQKQQALADLREQLAKKAELEKVADQKVSVFSNDFSKRGDIESANRQLENPQFKDNLALLYDRVEQLDASIAKFEGPAGTLRDLNVKLQGAIDNVAVKNSEVEINIARLEQEFAVNDFAARAGSLATRQKEQATEINGVLDQVTASTDTAKSVTAGLRALASDGVITANESEEYARKSVQLVGLIQSNQATAGANTDSVIRSLTRLSEQERITNQRLQKIEAALGEIQRF